MLPRPLKSRYAQSFPDSYGTYIISQYNLVYSFKNLILFLWANVSRIILEKQKKNNKLFLMKLFGALSQVRGGDACRAKLSREHWRPGL